MLITGLMLKYPDTIFAFMSGSALLSARQFHSFVSTFFGIVFFLQMVTGVAMYYTTTLLKIGKKSPPTSPSANTK